MRTLQKVNKVKHGDENHHRLSSFLYREGTLDITQFASINNDVYAVKTIENKTWIVKRHRHFKSVQQQWHFFEQLMFAPIVSFTVFPNGKKILFDGHDYWTLSPFMSGRSLKYKDDQDRKAAVKTMQRFHAAAKGIHVHNRVKKPTTPVRWHHRLLAFKQTKFMFDDYGYLHLYNDIVDVAETYLQLLSRFPWSMYESEAKSSGTWIHGDVASHNFIHGDQTCLIDFDLLTCTDQIYDYIQLGQRFLPYINWDLNQLLTYDMVDEADLDKWLFAICIPADVMREWLYYLSKNPVRSPKKYLVKMEEAWTERKLFLRNVQSMLKLV